MTSPTLDSQAVPDARVLQATKWTAATKVATRMMVMVKAVSRAFRPAIISLPNRIPSSQANTSLPADG
eukprot:4974242-Prorocentrum_lima.AAC.1